MKVLTDSAGNNYVNVGLLRLTYIHAEDRSRDKNWAGQDVIRIQQYRDVSMASKSLNMGAEHPVGKPEQLIALLDGFIHLFQNR